MFPADCGKTAGPLRKRRGYRDRWQLFHAADKVFPERRKKQSWDSYDVRRAREKYNRNNELPRTMLARALRHDYI